MQAGEDTARGPRITPAGEVTRERVVRAAMEAFASNGYRGASLDGIAGAVGLTRQGLLHYFPSKVALLMAVLELGQQGDIELIGRLREQHDWSLPETLRAIIEHNLSRPGLAQLRTALAGEAINTNHPGHGWFVDVYRFARAGITEWVTREQSEGRITSAVSPERLAMTIIAVIDGLQLQALLEPERLDVAQALAELMAVLAAS
jgi:AcrR family transcriptional regulator